MGSLSRARVVIIICCLVVTALGINFNSAPSIQPRDATLADTVLPAMEIWKNQGTIPLSENIVTALELDDYLNNSFVNGKENVFLYVGYYLSQKKVGAAHSPLVCFTGQGWELSGLNNLSLQIGNDNIKLASMIIAKGEEKQLVLYWFQAFDKTSSGTLMQKVNLLKSKLLHSREDNAFVRVVIPFGQEKSLQEAKEIGIQFIEYFYPIFKDYILFVLGKSVSAEDG